VSSFRFQAWSELRLRKTISEELDREARLARGIGEALIRCDQGKPKRAVFAGLQRGCQLHCIGSTQRVKLEQSASAGHDAGRFVDRKPPANQLFCKALAGEKLPLRDRSHSPEPGQSAVNFNLGCPPSNDSILCVKNLCAGRLGLCDAERDESACIPESKRTAHRSSRSSRQT
jgi:hypothetical protein